VGAVFGSGPWHYLTSDAALTANYRNPLGSIHWATPVIGTEGRTKGESTLAGDGFDDVGKG